MITRAKYLSALEVIDKYHEQDKPIFNTHRKVLISEWIHCCPIKPSERLYRILTDLHSNDDIKYIEDITRFIFFNKRNAGKKSWEEFCKLRGIWQ